MQAAKTEFSPKPELEYPFGLKWSPPEGEPFAVAEGVYWLRMPLPIDLDHINLWLLQDGDAWVIVDTGFDHDSCRAVWDKVFAEFIKDKPVSKIIVTHFHPDHIGLAAWLHHRTGARVHISKGEFALYRSIVEREATQYQKEAIAFAIELGYDDEFAQRFAKLTSSDDKPEDTRVQTTMIDTIEEGDSFVIGGQDWRVVCGNGHSPEHACLWNKDAAVMISGDQAIPRISSNVSVYPSNRHKDPLGDWISSCKKLEQTIPADTLVLPSHQEPFIGIKPRMRQLIDDHKAQLNRLRLAVDLPMSVIQARNVLFNRELGPIDTLLATGETLAHLNYLAHRDEILSDLDDDGVMRFRMRHS